LQFIQDGMGLSAGLSKRAMDAGFTICAIPLLPNWPNSGASDSTIIAIVGHLSRAVLERYSHIRMNAERRAVESLSLKPKAEQPRKEVPK
jgi:hypothetical protein